ncbi:MAG TPA: universal stress protein [Actinomycetes bacterium]
MTARSFEPDPVLVGVDGSEESTRAVRWAAEEAALRGAGLHIVHAWLWPLFRVPLGGSPVAPPGAGLQALADRVLADAAATARSVAGLVVETTLAVGEPATELLRRAPGAQLVVVGSRGLGGFTGLLLGSTGIALSARSPRPVAVVRGTATPHGPVVAGMNGSADADAVLRSAFREAVLHRTRLLVVHSWTIGLEQAHLAATGYEKAERVARQQAEELVEKAISRVAVEFDQVVVSSRLGGASAAADLVTASQGARLLVVGSGGLGPLRGLLLGSTTHAVVHHAACPVLVQR